MIGTGGAGVIKFWGPHENGDFRSPFSLYDFGDPSMNMGTPQFSSMFIVKLKESGLP